MDDRGLSDAPADPALEVGWDRQMQARQMLFIITVYHYNVALGSGGWVFGVSTVPEGGANAFGYQAKISLSSIASKNTEVFVEGNYLGNTNVNLGSGATFGSFNRFGVKAGFRYRVGRQHRLKIASLVNQPSVWQSSTR